MSTTTISEPVAVEHGKCLMCGASWPLEKSGVIARHGVQPEVLGNHAEYAEPFSDHVVCLGSGHTRQHDDGRDDARRFAIRNCATAEAIATRAMAKMEGLDFARALDYAGESALVHRALAKLWRNFAIHGEWPTGVRDALRFALGEAPESNPMHQALTYAQALAGRQWLRESKWELQRAYTDGVPADDFATMLFEV
jgi:hypothetical protein